MYVCKVAAELEFKNTYILSLLITTTLTTTAKSNYKKFQSSLEE